MKAACTVLFVLSLKTCSLKHEIRLKVTKSLLDRAKIHLACGTDDKTPLTFRNGDCGTQPTLLEWKFSTKHKDWFIFYYSLFKIIYDLSSFQEHILFIHQQSHACRQHSLILYSSPLFSPAPYEHAHMSPFKYHVLSFF